MRRASHVGEICWLLNAPTLKLTGKSKQWKVTEAFVFSHSPDPRDGNATLRVNFKYETEKRLPEKKKNIHTTVLPMWPPAPCRRYSFSVCELNFCAFIAGN